jgi:hypothetical protein
MTFQIVRGAIQKLTSDALVAAGIPFDQHCFDNVQEDAPVDPSGSYAVINVSFPNTVSGAIGCEGADRIIGSCNLLVYTPKRQGMKPAEDVMQAVLKEWVRVNGAMVNESSVHLKTWNINGPNGLAPDQRPFQATQLSCAFTARVA